jgi:hypothetical protein
MDLLTVALIDNVLAEGSRQMFGEPHPSPKRRHRRHRWLRRRPQASA